MYEAINTKRFEASLELCKKRKYNIELLKEVINLLLANKPLPKRCRPHKLRGTRPERWECHIKGDWLLTYRYDYINQAIIFEDTGTHSDLF